MLFNKSLDEGVLPEEWKLANIVPVNKKGERECTDNYRPISLLPIVSKVLERCVFCNIKVHLFQLIQKSQHGFISGKSCITNLLEVLEFIGLELDAGGQIDVIYLDISKAFDKVNHEHLTHKLRMAGFGGKLLQWFHSYLTNRNQRVTVLGATSNTLPVTSGVPQAQLLALSSLSYTSTTFLTRSHPAKLQCSPTIPNYSPPLKEKTTVNAFKVISTTCKHGH